MECMVPGWTGDDGIESHIRDKQIKHHCITIPLLSVCVCVCVSVGVKKEVLLSHFPSDLHSNALLPLTDEAGNGYCQCEASLL